MKKILLVLILQMLCVLPVSAEQAASGHMRWAAENGIILGMGNGELEPDGYVSRAQLAAMLDRAYAPTAEGEPGIYSDVSETDWYYPYVMSLSAAGIMFGDGTTWRPEDKVTREEAVTAVVRASDENVRGEAADISDSAEISDWARPYINTAVKLGIISENGEFRPKDIATRDELAEMLYNGRAYMSESGLEPFIDEDGSAWTPIYR